MRILYLVSASFQQLPMPDVTRSLSEYFRQQVPVNHKRGILLYPESLQLPVTDFAQASPYSQKVGLEVNREAWWRLRDTDFDQIIVLGTQSLIDYEEIVLACFLNGTKKLYLSTDGRVHDIADWQSAIRLDPVFRPVYVKRFPAERQLQYIRRVHRWLTSELIAADFSMPRSPIARRPELSLYVQPRLALDLAQLTDLQHESHGEPFSTFMFPDGSIVQSTDFYRSLANFVLAVDGVDSVLDVGCGSGFLATLLAGSGKLSRVVGVDSSPTRVASARLHAELARGKATFEVMSITDLKYEDDAFDLIVTSFALEQTGDHLARAIRELSRVSRKFLVLFEPSTEYFPTIPSMWHVPHWGWANSYHGVLTALGHSFAVRPNLLRHYYNPGTVFVVDLLNSINPMLGQPQLFDPAPDAWPGGVKHLPQ